MFFKNNKEQDTEKNISEKWYEVDNKNKCIKIKNGVVCGNAIRNDIKFEGIKEFSDKIIITCKESTEIDTDKKELDEEILNNICQHLIYNDHLLKRPSSDVFGNYYYGTKNINIEKNKNNMILEYLVEYTIEHVPHEIAVYKGTCNTYNILYDTVTISTLETPKDIFNKIKPYKLIETEEEFDDYISRKCSVDDYCFLKVAKIIRAYGYGTAFHQFIPNIKNMNDLNKLKSLMDELKDPDVLYLALYKNFKEEE